MNQKRKQTIKYHQPSKPRGNTTKNHRKEDFLMSKNLNVLLVEDSEDDAILLERALKKGGLKPTITRVQTKEEMNKQLQKNTWDIVISDYVMPMFSGQDALNITRKFDEDMPFIMVSGKMGEETAVETMKAGAHDYIVKNNLYRLVPAVKRELEEATMRREKRKAQHELEKTNQQMKKEIHDRKNAEQVAVQTKNHLQNIINSTTELIFSLDQNNRVTSWNSTMERITGFKSDDVLNRSISKIQAFEPTTGFQDIIKTTQKEKKTPQEEFIIRTKDNAKKILRVTASQIKGNNNNHQGIVFVGKDITPEMETHGRLLDGHSYLLPNKQKTAGTDLFFDLTRSHFDGLYITRSQPEMVESILPTEEVDVVYLRQSPLENGQVISDINEVITTVENHMGNHEKSIILLDGVHYLITRFSFADFIAMVYQLNDLVSSQKHIMLVRVDPDLFDSAELAIVQNELQLLPSQKVEGLIIEDILYETLKYIHEQNQRNALVSFKKIMQRFSIVYSTAAKRIEELEDKGLIYTKRKGKLRTVYVTEKGKTLLHKRQVV